MSINIKIDAFEGPMDLLLHLIKKAEVDIYDIPISEITEQYIGYLKKMEELDLNIASEFLVMAATLLEIKSQMLLPKKKTVDDEISADMDPRQELVEKLIEYKKYKEFAEKLKYIETDNFVYFKPPEIIEDIENVEIMFKNITLDNLMHAFKKIVNTYENKFNKRSAIPRDIDFDEYRIEDKMSDIQRLLQKNRSVSFNYFFEGAENKLEIIVIFLAMLELIKLKYISVIQYNNFGDIVIEGQDDLWKTS
jgi:segregation and condensation protein A